MSFFIFMFFVALGVEAGNKKIIDLHHKEKSSFEVNGLNGIFTSAFKDQYNLEHEDREDKIERIIEKIPYLKYLGICAIWLTPIYPSPGVDLGYDISDYRGIDEIFGTMKDFEELVTKLHENGIKIILDFVPNHTSNKHEWFIKSVQSIEPYTDYYLWVDAKYVNGTRQVPNNWLAVFGNSVWEWNEIRQQYYLHQFFTEQPDLNFRNPLVLEELKDLIRFWLDKGIDGIRVDAISHAYEREDLSDAPIMDNGKPQKYGYTNGLIEDFYVINDWRSLLDEYKKKDGQTRLIMVESYLEYIYSMNFYGNETNLGAHFPLNLCLAYLYHKPAKEYVEILTKWMSNLPSGAWSSWTIGNHDFAPRAASRFGSELIDGIHMLQLLLPGTPIIFMADELGMTDTYLRYDQLDDMSKRTGFLREKARTPFQWDSSPQAGFSHKSITWLPVNPNYVTMNVEFEKNTKRSHLKIFKEILNLRQLEIFRTGDLELYEISEYVFAFSRSNRFLKSYIIVINLGSELENINLKELKVKLSSKLTVKISSLFAEQNNGDVVNAQSFTLRPSAALVLESSFY